MNDTNIAAASYPDALALIHEEHRVAVVAHPEWRAVATEHDPPLQLVWMVRQGLLTYDDLYDLLSFAESVSDSDRIIEDAFTELGREHALINGECLGQSPGN